MVAVGDPWIPSNMDKGHLIKYFILLAALMMLGLVRQVVHPPPLL
jgi:hypothetical protein